MAKKRGPGRPRKNGTQPKKKRREECIVTRPDENGNIKCPRCGDDQSLDLKRVSTAGVKYYFCWSETCKNSGVRKGRGRSFVIRSDKSTWPKPKKK
jgi:transcription elongation factor Elf1